MLKTEAIKKCILTPEKLKSLSNNALKSANTRYDINKVVGSILEGIGINAIIPLLSFLTGADNHGEDFISKAMKDAFNYFGIDLCAGQSKTGNIAIVGSSDCRAGKIGIYYSRMRIFPP